jgi:type IV pilus assembly protein PilB
MTLATSEQHVGEPIKDSQGASRKDAPVAAAPRAGRATLGQQLVGADIITPQQLDLALAEGSQKGLRLGEALVEMGMVQEDAILPFIEGHLGVPAVRLRDGMIDPIAVRLLPRKVAERVDAIALFKVRDTICVAMADPQNLEQLDEIERVTDLRVRPATASRCGRSRFDQRRIDARRQPDHQSGELFAGAGNSRGGERHPH